jgi:hypothetical protein
MKILASIMIAVALLLTGLAVGFEKGKVTGFETGSEWAILQAGLLAREAGVYMPVQLDENGLRVVVKQPRGLYKKARQRATQYDQGRGRELKTAELRKPDGAVVDVADNSVQQAEF